jgi:hypothetical protein
MSSPKERLLAANRIDVLLNGAALSVAFLAMAILFGWLLALG